LSRQNPAGAKPPPGTPPLEVNEVRELAQPPAAEVDSPATRHEFAERQTAEAPPSAALETPVNQAEREAPSLAIEVSRGEVEPSKTLEQPQRIETVTIESVVLQPEVTRETAPIEPHPANPPEPITEEVAPVEERVVESSPLDISFDSTSPDLVRSIQEQVRVQDVRDIEHVHYALPVPVILEADPQPAMLSVRAVPAREPRQDLEPIPPVRRQESDAISVSIGRIHVEVHAPAASPTLQAPPPSPVPRRSSLRQARPTDLRRLYLRDV
jgi:hypothetical protein